MRIEPIPPESQPRQAWRNGGGSTREIARSDLHGALEWRASLAQVDASGAFSAFPGCMRSSALVDGGPLTLEWPDGAELALEPRMRAHAYAGDPAPFGRLDGRPALVFNLIARKGLDVQLLPRTLVGSMLFFDQVGVDWLVCVLSGEAELRLGADRHWLGAQHAALLHGEGSSQRAVLDGGGELMLVRIAR